MASRLGIRISAIAAASCGSILGYDLYEKSVAQTSSPVRPKQCVLQKSFNVANCEHQQGKLRNGLSLKQVLVVFRHGARTPMGPNRHIPPELWDPEVLMGDIKEKHLRYKLQTLDGVDAGDSSLEHYFPRKVLQGGSEAGSLTIVGQKQMFNLGKELKDEYVLKFGLLKKDCDENAVYARTTNINRTIQSVVCLLSGIYEPENVCEPLPIITGPLEKESMYPNYYNCKKLHHWVRRTFASVDHLPSLQKLTLEVMNIASLEDCSSPMEIILVRDEVAARVAHSISVPQVLLDKYDVLEQAAVLVQAAVVRGENDLGLLRVSIGHFMEELCQKMEDFIEHKTSHKMCLFSSHDTSIMTLLMALGVFDNHWPEFASHLKFELLTDEKDAWYVRIVYNNKDLTLPGCSSPYCSWERFQELVAPCRVKDWDEECGNDQVADS